MRLTLGIRSSLYLISFLILKNLEGYISKTFVGGYKLEEILLPKCFHDTLVMNRSRTPQR